MIVHASHALVLPCLFVVACSGGSSATDASVLPDAAVPVGASVVADEGVDQAMPTGPASWPSLGWTDEGATSGDESGWFFPGGGGPILSADRRHARHVVVRAQVVHGENPIVVEWWDGNHSKPLKCDDADPASIPTFEVDYQLDGSLVGVLTCQPTSGKATSAVVTATGGTWTSIATDIHQAPGAAPLVGNWPPSHIAVTAGAAGRVLFFGGASAWDATGHVSDPTSWTQLTTSATVGQITFVDDETALSYDGALHVCHLAATTFTCDAPVTGVAVDQNTRLLAFADESAYVATNGRLFTSSNAGASWSERTLPDADSSSAAAFSFTFTKGGLGYAWRSVGTTSGLGTHFVTHDGGATWTTPFDFPSTYVTSGVAGQLDSAGTLFVNTGGLWSRSL